MRRFIFIVLILGLAFMSRAAVMAAAPAAPSAIRLLLIDGPDPAHNAAALSTQTADALKACGRFEVKVVTAPALKAGLDAWAAFAPSFKDHHAVILNYWVDDDWPDRPYEQLEKYVAEGGGLVVIHSALASFPKRESFSRMLGIVWRRQGSGVGLSFDALGRLVRTPVPANRKSGHGPLHEFRIDLRDQRHPITANLPQTWMHTRDELYDGMCGPAEKIEVLASAYSNRTKAQEPALWTCTFGKGRVFSTVLGHDRTARQCVGHQVTLLRGCEWAATGDTSIPVPPNIPDADRSSSGEPRWPRFSRPSTDVIRRHMDPSVQVFGRFAAVRLPVTKGVPLHNPTAIAAGPEGVIYVANYTGQILRLSDSDGDGLQDTASLFADITRIGDGRDAKDAARFPGVPVHGNLRYPTAMSWRSGKLYVATTQEVRTFRDSDGDGLADESSTFASGWPFNMHYFCWTFGCKFGPDGHLYLSLCSDYHFEHAPPDPKRLRGAVLRVSPDGKTIEKFADGVRYPYGMAFNEAGELFVSDNKGGGNADEELNHVVRGGNYGHNPHGPPDGNRQPRAPTLPVQYGSGAGGMVFNPPGNSFGGTAGDLFLCMWGPDGQWSVGSIVRVRLERQADGSYRASEHRFAQGPAKVIDACFSSDGDLYVAQFGKEGPRHVPTSNPEGGVYRFVPAPWVTPVREAVNPLDRRLVGDPIKGQVLFAQRGCQQCHSIDAATITLGPDLKNVGATLSVAGLRQSLEQPGISVKTDYDAYQVTTTDGERMVGRLLATSSDSVQLISAGSAPVTLPRKQIEQLEPLATSLMPPGLLAGLDPQAVNDLLAYLQTLRGDERVLRINCGGEEIRDSAGRLWQADQSFHEGGFGALSGDLSRNYAIAEPLARTCRHGNVQYRIAAEEGEYDVTIWLAESHFTEADKRVFSVYVQGRPVVEKIDLVREAGLGKLVSRTIRVAAAGGKLEITGKATANRALISGIEVRAVREAASASAAVPAPSPTPASATSEPSATTAPTAQNQPRQYEWRQEQGRSLSLLLNDQPLWTLQCDPEKDKPYLHPLRTVGGANLTWLRPSDHIWHRALWFSWKTINGVNYWEENPKTGLSPGRTRITRATFETGKDWQARAVVELSYHPEGKPIVMTERRTLTMKPPDARGDYWIDVHHAFQAGDVDVIFDRTDPTKQNWGGYAGMSLRADPGIHQWKFLDSEERRDLEISSKRAKWVDLSGVFGKPEGKPAGITIIDHPGNPRHPSPWYIVIRDAKDGPFIYFNAAILYHEPLTLKAKQKLELNYRVLVHDGPADVERIKQAYENFSAKK